MLAFELADLSAQQQQTTTAYLEFLRVAALSVGIYTLEAGSIDPQQPHSEAEVYYIVSGQSDIQVGAEVRSVKAGSIIFVEAGVSHKFLNIREKLLVLVFFAPAEYTQKDSSV
jgi:mannose-6-phosphate isomerase-like protein (cupin superfamily)